MMRKDQDEAILQIEISGVLISPTSPGLKSNNVSV